MHSFYVLLFLLAVRLFSVFAVQTWFVPDEYWQCLEVAHKLAFGYGYLTWEWTQGIRSYLHPVIIAGVYKALAWAGLDTVQLLVVVPRVLQAILSAVADYRFYKWSNSSKWSLYLISTSWFWFYMGSRTLANTTETSLTMIALSYFPWHYKEKTGFLWIVGLLAFIRPTGIIPWIPLCLYHMWLSKYTVSELIWKKYLVIAIVLGGALVSLDSYVHGSLIFTPWEFVKANVINEIGSFYGENPWHYYLSVATPTVLGSFGIPFLIAATQTMHYTFAMPIRFIVLTAVHFTFIVYSLFPHKEFRFVLPLLPMCVYIVADFLSRWSRRAPSYQVWLVALALLAGNAFPAYYVGTVHNRGTMDVMPALEQVARLYHSPSGQPAKFLFLMPCHSTPFYSHIHQNVTMRFLTCQPNLHKQDNYVDVAEQFYNDPPSWLRAHIPVYPKSALPSHVILFDSLADKISVFLQNFYMIYDGFHTEYPTERVGRSVQIYERIDDDAESV